MGIKLKGDIKFIAENSKDMGATGPLWQYLLKIGE
jgi:hypothetical protein